MTLFKNYLEQEIDALQSGGSIATWTLTTTSESGLTLDSWVSVGSLPSWGTLPGGAISLSSGEYLFALSIEFGYSVAPTTGAVYVSSTNDGAHFDGIGLIVSATELTAFGSDLDLTGCGLVSITSGLPTIHYNSGLNQAITMDFAQLKITKLV